MTMSRRMRAVAVAVTLAAAAAPGAVAQDRIKIGLIQPFTGPLSAVGIEGTNGFMHYFEQQGMKVAGREIVIVKEDSAGIPAQAMERTRRLIERENVSFVAGLTNSAEAYAVRDYINDRQVPLIIISNAGANDITAKLASPYIFRTSFSNYQLNAPFGPYVCDKLGYKKIVVMASDFVTGYEMSAGFESTYTKSGCTIVKKIMAPLGTVDFAPFLAQVPASGIDGMWAMFFAADAIAFVKQYQAFGLKGKLPLVGTGSFSDQTLLESMGEAGLGIVGSTTYVPDFASPENQAFLASFRAKYKILPSSTTVSGNIAAEAIARAIEAIDGKVEDKPRFLAALRQVKFASPQGPFRFDDKQNVVFDMYIVRNVKKDGVVTPETVEKLASDVDQFWHKE